MDLIKSKTFQNLVNSFAGECQAHMRYKYLAYGAKDRSLFMVERQIQELSKNEMHHARMFYTFIQSADTQTLDNLQVSSGYPFKENWDFVKNFEFAAENEHDEHTVIYPQFAQTAREEGFEAIACLYDLIAAVESCHDKSLTELHRRIGADTRDTRDTPVKWKCSVCGHEATLNQAWDMCPLCKSPQGYVELNLTGK